MNHELLYSLEKLDMLGNSEGVTGLVSVDKYSSHDDIPPEEFIALENARKYKAHYVYFRRFENRPSVPQVYLYDYTNDIGVDEEYLTDLHRQLYSSGLIPMFFVFTKQDVRIFNCFEQPAEGKKLKYKPLTTIRLAANLSEAIDTKSEEDFKAFSGRSFDNGTFWESSKYSPQFKFNNGAYEKLLTELKQALKDIIDKNVLPANFAHRIMVLSILIKYLEEREDGNGNKVFPEDFFSNFADKATRFTDVLNTKGAFVKLLDYLAHHFNGGIFQIDEEERDVITNRDLSRFGQFLQGETEGIQFVFWRLYSFNDLPVELISNIYEEFLGKQPGIVYTPPYLVNFLLDEAMPLTNEETDFKILDPACGSGVFLVGAYRRLIYRWRKKNGWDYPDLGTLKKLLRDNIYGVELKKEAAELTIFSLSLALCDELTPLQIWKDLRFDDLHKENILHDDFFTAVKDQKLNKAFDLIIGNPPFEAKLTPAAAESEVIRSKSRLLIDDKGKETQVVLPDNQISLLFLEESIDLCKKEGLVCLIQPSGPLLYNNSSFQFRQVMLKKHNVPQIIDFTHISRVLFGKNGDVATAAIFVKNEPSKSKPLLHITVRRTKPHKEKLYFELDTYDFHYVPFALAYSDPLVWKANFLGGSRFNQLVKRLKDLPTLENYIKSKGEGWAISEGFTAATKGDKSSLSRLLSDTENTEYLKFKEKLEAPFLQDKRYLPTDALTIDGIDQKKIQDSTPVDLFHSKGNPKIYNAPHILIKEVISNNTIPMELSLEDLSFQRRIIGIHAPMQKLDDLRQIVDRISGNKLYTFYIALTSGQYLINKSSAIYKQDIDNLPFPEDEEELKTSLEENILIEDFNTYLLEFRRNGEKSKIAVSDVTAQNLLDFSNSFCSVLRSVFKTINPGEYLETDSYICFPFYFGEKPIIEFEDQDQAEKAIETLVEKNLGISLRTVRIVRLYEGNVVYLIKPKKLRYWLKSIALRDADETFSDLRKQGY
ncbi:Eco57I restriction-modification methylase domain-containing protein [Sphingobacterium cellulitidis]|uniref:Eco57I restriction-modification methylase domain-containing protein n=1 Tax=Sphingobacterium cellulitidis TaxID=1768011 RepID=UPI000B9463FC|nr:hypothetical protein CHT99_18250 [Sphingobacterium cellulitidis]